MKVTKESRTIEAEAGSTKLLITTDGYELKTISVTTDNFSEVKQIKNLSKTELERLFVILVSEEIKCSCGDYLTEMF